MFFMDILVPVERIANVHVVGRAEANQPDAVVGSSSGRSEGTDDMFKSLTIAVDLCIEICERQNDVVSRRGVDLLLQVIIKRIFDRVFSAVDRCVGLADRDPSVSTLQTGRYNPIWDRFPSDYSRTCALREDDSYASDVGGVVAGEDDQLPIDNNRPLPVRLISLIPKMSIR